MLKEAVILEDRFLYMEPPRVYQPVRQCLGYVLLQSGSLQQAEAVRSSWRSSQCLTIPSKDQQLEPNGDVQGFDE